MNSKVVEESEAKRRAEQPLLRMENTESPRASPRAGFISDIFIHPLEKGVNRITFKFTDDTGDFWIAKYHSWQGVSKRPCKNKDKEVGGKLR